LAKEILGSKDFAYNIWTRAVILYTMNKEDIIENIDLVNAHISSQELLLRETGGKALKKLALTI